MKIKSFGEIKLDKIATTGRGPYNLSGAWFDGRQWLYVTDTKTLVAVEVEKEKGDQRGFLPIAIFKKWLTYIKDKRGKRIKTYGGDSAGSTRAETTVNFKAGAKYLRHEQNGNTETIKHDRNTGKFPSFWNVLKKLTSRIRNKKYLPIMINAQYMIDALTILQARNNDVVLYIPKDWYKSHDPILAETMQTRECPERILAAIMSVTGDRGPEEIRKQCGFYKIRTPRKATHGK